MFASDERVSAHGSENSAGKEKTGNKISGGVKKSAEGRNFLGVFFKSSLRKDENNVFFVIYLVINLSYFNVCFFFFNPQFVIISSPLNKPQKHSSSVD